MLRAYSEMPSDEFVAQLRAYVIAMRLSQQVIDCVDNLTGVNSNEDAHTLEMQEAEERAKRGGRESIKLEMIAGVTRWLESQPNYDMIAAPVEAVLTLLEKVEV